MAATGIGVTLEEMTADELRVANDPARLRYELFVGDTLAGFIVYAMRSGVLTLIHTEVDSALERRGLGSRLVAGALDDIRARGLLVEPSCSFVSAFIGRHPEYADLVAPEGL